MKCYQYDSNGCFKFVTEDYGQGLPHNATYVEPPEEREGYLLKFNNQFESWGYEEIPAEEKPEIHVPTQQELLDQLNKWLNVKNSEIADDLARDLVAGLTLKESQAIADKEKQVITTEYTEKLESIQAGDNPFKTDEVSK